MRNFFIVLLCLAFFPAMSMAKAPSKKAAAPKPELVVPEKDCQYLLAYQPSPDTEYQPGVDVHGKPVMEADITPSVVKPPDKFQFNITVDMARYLGIAAPAGLEGEASMGTITVEKGQAKFNGTPLEGDAQAALKALCATQKDKKPPK